MARLLFVTWNDNELVAQFSVPPDCTLAKITSEPVVLSELTEGADPTNGEFLLDASRVRVAYMVDVPDGVMVNRIEPVPVEAADPEWMVPGEELEALSDDEARDRALADQ